MLATSLRKVALPLLVAASAAMLSGCYVDADIEPAVAVSSYEGYNPVYYDGYVVYYDTVGRPYYYVGGSRYWVPRSYPYYGYYTTHYHSNWRSYNSWYARRGYGYKTYRAPARYRSHPTPHYNTRHR
jgi:hypothetical protein